MADGILSQIFNKLETLSAERKFKRWKSKKMVKLIVEENIYIQEFLDYAKWYNYKLDWDLSKAYIIYLKNVEYK